MANTCSLYHSSSIASPSCIITRRSPFGRADRGTTGTQFFNGRDLGCFASNQQWLRRVVKVVERGERVKKLWFGRRVKKVIGFGE
ncbi:hypothetical protein Lal_00007804 [Lupinus albus]|nr:hypothetical protein Lal_00007804 [Lupinus albus]